LIFNIRFKRYHCKHSWRRVRTIEVCSE